VGKFIATRSPPSIRADPARAGVSKHLPRGRRWRIRRGLFPPDFFPVVTHGEFEVQSSSLAVARFVLDPHVGYWNLSSNDLKPMPFGNEMFLLGRSPARTALLHLVVENDPEISASLRLDLLRGLSIEPVEIDVAASRGLAQILLIVLAVRTRARCRGKSRLRRR